MRIGKSPLLKETVSTIRRKGYSYQTEKTYLRWIIRYIRFHNKQHPKNLGTEEIAQFLSYLATERRVATSTQNQALNAIVFLYKEVLKIQIGDFGKYLRAKKPKLLPVVLSQREVTAILNNLRGSPFLMTSLLYGSGLRLNECLSLRIKDIDFDRNQVFIRQAKGKKDRIVPLPLTLKTHLEDHLKRVHKLYENDREKKRHGASLPYALDVKYPNAQYEWKWQYVFPSKNFSKDPRTNRIRRHHAHQSVLIRHIRKAAQHASITKKITTHSFRHSFATHLVEQGCDIRTLKELLGHHNLKTTQIYTHVSKSGLAGAKSPLDLIENIAQQEISSESTALETEASREEKPEAPSRFWVTLSTKLFSLIRKQ